MAKAYAALLTGPPRSKHIIRPRMTPSRIAEEPDSPLSQSCRPVVMAASGRPSTSSISPPAISVAPSGMTATGMRPRAQAGTLRAADPQGGEAGEQTADEPADEAGADEAGDRADGEAGRDAGPVGDGVGDVAGERRHQEAERQRAELEQHRAEVGGEPAVGQVRQGVVRARRRRRRR